MHSKLADGKPIGGAGRLSDRMIEILQHYFGLAVRGNTGNLTSMAKTAWAAVVHKVRDDDPAKQNRFCLQGRRAGAVGK